MTQPTTTDAVHVVLDISVLDEINVGTANKTGVFRVVDRLALQLAARPDCDVAFACGRAILDVDHLLAKVAAEYPELARVRPARLWGPPAVPERASVVRTAMQRLAESKEQTLAARLRRRLLRLQLSALKRRARFEAAVLPQPGIFHSPWAPLPPRRHFRGGKCCRAITIYDMTPVLFPAFFRGNEKLVRAFGVMLKSIEPDDHVIAISECTKRDFCGITRHDPARVHVTPLAADERMFSAVRNPQAVAVMRRKYSIPDGPYLLSVNTLQPRKNIDHCVRTFARMVQQQRIGDLSLVLVGDRGWEARQIDEARQAAGLSDRQIITTGYVPDGDLAALYSGAMAFIYVSRYEGFGLPALEAMQCGVPVIASNNSSLPEVVADAGMLVAPTDGDALCAAILSLYADPSLRESYAARAAARAREFSWRKCADLTVSAYRDMLSKAG